MASKSNEFLRSSKVRLMENKMSFAEVYCSEDVHLRLQHKAASQSASEGSNSEVLDMKYQTIGVGASAFISYPLRRNQRVTITHTSVSRRQPASKSTFGQTSPIPPLINYPSVSSSCCMDVAVLANPNTSRILRSVCFAFSVPLPPTAAGSVSSSLHLL
jgi:hypothetical protein